ncbi:unnamed protein product [Phaedon cochleariae]|uniref:Uncharacterized protein n=1 Tax=Phaedon cochleariae TaxID=80249 RepID=A0A9P0DNH3_PHACE|nr:unnamed protein product [Phaedon cochleariae]
MKLNVPCSKGFMKFSGLNESHHSRQEDSYVYVKSHKQTPLCGKLEELSEEERHIYFPSSHIQPAMHLRGNPVFAIAYRLVDHCYNVTFLSTNGSFELRPNSQLQCTYKIFLPYGNRVVLKMWVGDTTVAGSSGTGINFQDSRNDDINCEGLLTELQDGSSSWFHCTKIGHEERQIELVSRQNRVVLKVTVRNPLSDQVVSTGTFAMRMSYHAEPIESVVGVCEFGWIKLRQFCISAMEGVKLPWRQAEIECARKDGHLLSLRSERDQTVLDNLLMNSPGYRDDNAYWIGASDESHEGDFKWTDGLPFSYSNWFPGWPEYGNYNHQPNDDGLSEQDCVEARRMFALTHASHRLATTFMWNDRDCSTPNYFVCERLQSKDPLEHSWLPNCNRTVFLSRDQPKSLVSSPGFPRQYPDNANCDIDITATPGFRIILDFEELVLENESSCSYDYLLIMESFNDSTWNNMSTSTKRLCGDWSAKLKLLRYVSHTSKLKLRFSSDYSHHFGGFKARVSMEIGK